MNTIYLYLHQIMLRNSHNKIIKRKEAMYIISERIKLAGKMNQHLVKDIRKVIIRNMLNDMCNLKLLERINRRKGFKIINLEKSSNINKGVLIDLLTINKT